MEHKRDESPKCQECQECQECYGNGWVYDWLGGCGDTACCGGPVRVKCMACDNDWSPLDDGDRND